MDHERIRDLAPEALAFDLVIASVEDNESGSVIPDPQELKQFAKNLLAWSGQLAIPSTVWPWQRSGETN